ncbi:MAG: FitA-like ribbon-helix-helix domain-containing protein [Solirubrobacterales bacterium]
MSKVIQVRDVPDRVHRRLKVRAAEQGRTLSDLVRTELVRIADRPTLEEMLERLSGRETPEIDESAADAIRAGRSER